MSDLIQHLHRAAAAQQQSGGGGSGYLLDDYPTDCTGAFSLRALSAATTYVARGRRLSDNAERDFAAGEITDGTLTGWAGSADVECITWYDQSSFARHFQKPSTERAPFLCKAGALYEINGRPYLFNELNTNPHLGWMQRDPSAYGFPWTMSVVGRWIPEHGPYRQFLGIHTFGGNAWRFETHEPMEIDGIAVPTLVGDMLWQLALIVPANPSPFDAWVNGTQQVSGGGNLDLSTWGPEDRLFTASPNSHWEHVRGWCGEWVQWGGTDYSAAIADINANVMNHFGIS